jgi:hypothetical protein
MEEYDLAASGRHTLKSVRAKLKNEPWTRAHQKTITYNQFEYTLWSRIVNSFELKFRSPIRVLIWEKLVNEKN